jgi:hypothetical protein
MHHLIYFTDILEALLLKERLKNLQTTNQTMPILCQLYCLVKLSIIFSDKLHFLGNRKI